MISLSTFPSNFNIYLTRPITIHSSKRYMLVARKLSISLIPKSPSKIIFRYPSLIAEGTSLKKIDYPDINKTLYYHNNYLINLNFENNIDIQTFVFYSKIMFITPKYFQFIASIAYPRTTYFFFSLKQFFPNIGISTEKSDLFVTEDVVVASVAAAQVIKKSPLFEKGRLTVLASEYDPTIKKEKINKLALIQTKQKHPDYVYVYNPIDKKNGIWQRYYDLKTGSFSINTGPIFCMSNKEEYEEKVAHHLHAQSRLYKNEDGIDKKYKQVLNDSTLSWSERNTKIQEFFRDNLHKYPEINPSFILYNPLLSEIDNLNIPKKFSGIVTQENIENVENAEKMIAHAIIKGGHKCQENYIKHPYNNPRIVELITKYLSSDSQI